MVAHRATCFKSSVLSAPFYPALALFDVTDAYLVKVRVKALYGLISKDFFGRF